jgi:hypothetical protein
MTMHLTIVYRDIMPGNQARKIAELSNPTQGAANAS